MLLTHNTKSIRQIYNRRNTRAMRDREAAQLFLKLRLDHLCAAARGDPDASPTPGKVCPQLPPTPMPPQVSSSAAYFIIAHALWMFGALCWCGRPSGNGDRHVKGEHVKIIFKRRNLGAKKVMLRRAVTRTRASPNACP